MVTETAKRHQLQTLNPDPKYPKAKLIAPSPLRHIYIGASVTPDTCPSHSLPPEPGAQVRVLSGAPFLRSPRTNAQKSR